MPKPTNALQLLRRIPPKWALAILGIMFLYWIGQPILNRSLGWNLPNIAKMFSHTEVSATSEPRSSPKTTSVSSSHNELNSFLEEVARDRFQSPAGLMYTRGSEEGHRLKHLAKHLEDQPTRPGSHGVFEGDLLQVLRWIDEGYQKAIEGDRSTRTRRDDHSTIYEITFDKTIGYIGGSDGIRRGNPPSRRLRIVVIDQNVITAFPF